MDRTYTIAEGVCQSWEAVVVEEGGERVCSTRLDNWTHPDTDDWSITRHDSRATLQHNVEDTRCDQHTLAFCVYIASTCILHYWMSKGCSHVEE